MSFGQTVVEDLAHCPAATTDFRTHQYKPVMLTPDGVVFASVDPGSLAGAAVYVLGNKPNSGNPCTLVNRPNVTKALCTGSVWIGCHVSVQASGAGFSAGSLGPYVGSAEVNMGVALEAANSGTLFALHLR
jgi:hypothetical protein